MKVFKIFCLGFLCFASLVRAEVSDQEKQLIDAWIKANHLNWVGDNEDQEYIGGTPLFDEDTGKVTDRYDYIVAHHPDKPWNNRVREEL